MELLERFVQGDLDAFESVFRQHQSSVYAWIVRIVRDPGAAEDLTIETFWRIYRSRASFDPHREFGGWAHRIALNLAYNHLRESRRWAPLERHLADRGAPAGSAGEELGECVRQAVGELPESLREVTSLALLDERSYPDVARMTGLTAGAVKSRVFRAMRLLRERLLEMGVRR